MSGAGAIHVLPVPTPFAVGRINCYLVDDDPLTLVDAGPNSATSLTALDAALAEHGRRIEDLERIVITHQHIDHIGLVSILADRSGAEVCALAALAPWLARYAEVMEDDDAFAEAIMLRHGIPEDVVFALRAVTRSYRAWGGELRGQHAADRRRAAALRRARVARLPPPGPLSIGHRLPRRGVGRARRRRPPHQAHLLQPAHLAPAGRRRSDRAPQGPGGLPGLAARHARRWSSAWCFRATASRSRTTAR